MLSRKQHVLRFAEEAKRHGITVAHVKLNLDCRYISIIKDRHGGFLHGCDEPDELLVYIRKACPDMGQRHVITMDAELVRTYTNFELELDPDYNNLHEPMPNTPGFVIPEIMYDNIDMCMSSISDASTMRRFVHLYTEWMLGRIGWEGFLRNSGILLFDMANAIRIYSTDEDHIPYDDGVWVSTPNGLCLYGMRRGKLGPTSVSRIARSVMGGYSLLEGWDIICNGELVDHTHRVQAGDTLYFVKPTRS